MLEIPMFWLGRLGDLHPLACPEPGVSNTILSQMATNVSVSASETRDLQGFRREWSLEEAYMDENDVMLFEAMYQGIIHPPLRIIDPLKKNRFRAAVSAATKQGYLNGGNDSWAPDSPGVMTIRVNEANRPAIEFTSLGDEREVSFQPTNSAGWNVTQEGARWWPNGMLRDRVNLVHRPSMVDPVLPGETVTVTFNARIVAGSAELGILLVGQDMTSTQGDVVSITGATWSDYSITYTAPTDGSVVGLVPYFESTSANSLDMRVSYAQLESGSEFTSYAIGYGAPECIISGMSAVSPRYPLVTAQLTIKEL